MVRTTLIAAAMATLGATPLLAQPQVFCQQRIDSLSAEFDDVLGNRAFGSGRVALRNLRNAAVNLKAQDLDAACMETVEALEVAMEAYRAAGPGEGAAIVAAPELGNIGKRSVLFDDAGLDTVRIEGADVYNYDNDYLGEVTGVVMDAARPTHVIVGDGGFWDRSSGRAAVPTSMMRWDPEWEAFFAPIPDEALGDAPEYEMAGSGWNAEENDRYYRQFAN